MNRTVAKIAYGLCRKGSQKNTLLVFRNLVHASRKQPSFYPPRTVGMVAVFSGTKKDYYQILGISKTATKPELKKKYFELAKKYHPV